MLRAAKLSTSVALSMVLALCVVLFSGVSSTMPRKARAAPARPNFVFILTDDMRKGDLRFMPQTRSLLGDRGMTFSNALVSDPLCTPSRASILRGQYPHNTHVFANETANGGGGTRSIRPTSRTRWARGCRTPATVPASSAST